MLIESSHCGAVPHDGSSTGYAAARLHSGRNLQSIPTEPTAREEEKRKKSGKEIGTRRRRQVIGMRALQWILLWILFGVKIKFKWWKAWRKGMPHTPRNGKHPLDGSISPREGKDDQPGRGPKDFSRRNRQGRGPLKRNKQGEDPRNCKENSQGRDPSIIEGRSCQAKRWRVQKKWKKVKWRKKKKMKKKVKHRKRKWGRSAKS